jgi:hypothetical protein
MSVTSALLLEDTSACVVTMPGSVGTNSNVPVIETISSSNSITP